MALTDVLQARLDNARLNQREADAGAEVLTSKPTRAWLSVTGKCNLLCTHCPRSLVDEMYLSSAEMTSDVFARVKQSLFPMLEFLRIGGNNLGEQLFAKSWPTFADEIKHGPFTPWLITNGQTLNRARIGDLVEAGYVIDISIDAASDAGYRQIRGASLTKLIDNVRAIVEARDARATAGARPAAKVMFSFTAFADNIGELPGLVRLAAQLRVDEVVVTHYMPSFEGQRQQSLFYHQQTANTAFDEARAIARDAGLALRVPPNYRIKSLGHEAALRDRVRSRYPAAETPAPAGDAIPPCAHPWTSVSIDEKGQVFPCCQSNLLMGDLRTSSFEEIWNNRRYRKLRRTVNTAKALPDCRQCVLRGASFTSVDCDEPAFFLRNLELTTWTSGTWHARLREWFAHTRVGRRVWQAGRSAYKNFIEWHVVR